LKQRKNKKILIFFKIFLKCKIKLKSFFYIYIFYGEICEFLGLFFIIFQGEKGWVLGFFGEGCGWFCGREKRGHS